MACSVLSQTVPLPERVDFCVGNKVPAPRLLKPFTNGRAGFLVESGDRQFVNHRQHGDGNRVLVFGRECASSFDGLFSNLVMGSFIDEN